MDDVPVLPQEVEVRDEEPLRLLALKDRDTFMVADTRGDICGGPDGLFESDTRLLSRLVLRMGDRRPSYLSSAVSSDNVFFTFHGTNRPLPPLGGRSVPPGVLHVERRRFLWDRRMYERVRLTNHALDEVLAPLCVEFAADFRDMFEVRGHVRPAHGRHGEPVLDGRRVSFSYEGLDGVARASVIAFSEPPFRLTGQRAEFAIPLAPRSYVDLYIEVAPDAGDVPDQTRYRAAAAKARRAMRTRQRRGAALSTNSPQFNLWIEQSRADVALLATELSTGPYPYAGIPWFSTPFGRDGIICAWQCLWLEPALARGVLTYLAARQATETSAFRDSQPGKIMHETRRGEMSALGEVPFALYYGGVDTTPLFVALAGAYAQRTGDLDFIRQLWPALTAAAGWMRDYGDSDGDGLIDYQRAADTGLANQGWKDSYDSVFHTDGRFPSGPVALLEVQGYAYAAWKALAELGAVLGDDGAGEWAQRAEHVRRAVEERFWMEDQGFYALAVDGQGALCRPLASNAGHLLFTGLPGPERAQRVIQRLMTAEFHSGWGVRTLAQGQARYNPMSYHNGSVWPHDTAICAAGLARYGERVGVGDLLKDVFEAATHFDMRLPELFCGFARQPGEPPIAYPVACIPQAWAAGSVFMMLQACLGLTIDAMAKEVKLVRPYLPPGVSELRVKGLQVGECRADLTFERRRDGLVVAAASNCGPGLSVVTYN